MNEKLKEYLLINHKFMCFWKIIETLGKQAQSFPFYSQRGALFIKETTLED